MTNDNLFIAILPMTMLLISLTKAHLPLVSKDDFSYHSTVLRKEIISQ